MKHLYILSFLFITSLTLAQSPPPELQAYYSDVDFSNTGSNLYDDLAITTIAKHTTFLTYSERHQFLYNADEDPTNSNNVLLIYSGESRSKTEYLSGSNPNSPQTFNTEHVYPRSLLDIGISESDLHLLRSCDISVNSSRGNNPFTDGSGTPNQAYFSTGSSFFPGWDWRGDVARIIMYVNLRYNEPFTSVGSLNLFLEWNAADPVSDAEIEDSRNTVISGAQGNRNPFIDNPYLATIIWGGTPAQDRWETLSTNSLELQEFKIYPNPAKDQVNVSMKVNTDTRIEIYNILGIRVFTKIINESTALDISSLKSGLYLFKIIQNDSVTTKKLIVE
jgi:endonuclease I